MAANPFKKDDFPTFREWEQELAFFLLDQLRAPSTDGWQALAVDNESKRNAAFMAYQLSNFALVKGMPAEATLRPVFEFLLRRPLSLPEFAEWLSQKWVDQSRLSETLNTCLKDGVSRETHSLVI
ncbi:hypothetical protein ACFOFO_23585 [Undibacterium arcticum]|uniref:Uncharacterized protein n=1 Tax=Undibacterium arcticum TaxID=1762892 RepID=A0ABV7F796_9BURK